MAIEDFIVRLKANVKDYLRGSKAAIDATDKLGDSQRMLGKNTGDLNKNLSRSGKSANAIGGAFSKTAANTIALNQATQLLGASYNALNRVVNASIAPYAAYEKALVGVGKTTNIAGSELNALGASLQGLAERIPISTNELLTIGQAAGQLGVTGAANIANFSETIGKLGAASDLSGDEAATALTRILNVTGTSIDQIDEFASVIVGLGNNFAATESEIARMANETARATSVFGVSADESAALGAAMRSVGIRAELGGSAVGKAFRAINDSIQTGGDQLQALSELTGMTGEQLKQTFADDATAVFQTFIEGLNNIPANEVGAALEQFGLKGDEISKTLPVLAQRSDLVGKAISLAGKEMKNATALNDEAAKAFNTLDSQIKITQNVFSNLASDIGKQAAPAFKQFLETLRGLAPVIRATVTTFQSVDFTGIINTISQTGGVIASVLVPAILILNPALTKTAISTTVIAAKFIAIAAVIGGVVVAIDLLVRNANRIGDVFTVVVDSIRLGFLRMGQFIIDIFTDLIKKLTSGAGKLAAVFSKDLADAIKGVGESAGELNEKFQAEADKFGDVLKNSVDTAADGLDLGIVGKVIDEGKKALDKFNVSLDQSKKTSKALADNMKDAGESGTTQQTPQAQAGANIQAITPQLFDENSLGVIKGAFGGAFAAGAQTLSQGLGSAFLGPIAAAQSIVNAAQGLVNAVPDLLNSIAGLFDSITQLPQILLEAVVNLLSSAGDLIAEFIPNLINAIPKIVDAILTFLIEGLPRAFETLGEAIPQALAGLFDALPDIIVKGAIAFVDFFVLNGVKIAIAFIKGLVKGLPTLITALGKALPEIVPAILQGLKEGFFGLVGGFGKEAAKSFQVLGESLTGATSQLFEVVEGTVAARGQDTADRIREAIASSTRSAGDFLTRIWEALMTFLRNTWDVIVKLFEGGIIFLQEVWGTIFDLLKAVWKVVFETAKFVFEQIGNNLKVVWEAMMILLESAWSAVVTVFETVWNAAIAIFEGTVNALKIVWETVIGLFENVISVFQDVWNIVLDIFSGKLDVFEGIGMIFERIFQGAVDAFNILWDGVKDLFKNAADTFTNVFNTIFDGLKKVGETIGDGLKNAGTVIADGIKSAFTNAVNFFSDIGKTIFDAIQGALDRLNPANLLDKMFKFDGGGTGGVEELLGIDVPFVAFARGGQVPGLPKVSGDSEKNDRVMAFLSPGEFVLPRSVAQNDKVMEAISQVIAMGGNIPMFGFGGIVKALAKGDLEEAKRETQGTFKAPSSIDELTASLTKDIELIRAKVIDGLKAMINGTLARAGIPGSPTPATAQFADTVLGGVNLSAGIAAGIGGDLAALGFQRGGSVPGSTDTVPALLSPGEFIISQGAAQAIGLETLRQINQGRLPGGGGITNVTEISEGAIQITVTADQFDETFVRTDLMDMVKDSLREATNAGESIISSRGVF